MMENHRETNGHGTSTGSGSAYGTAGAAGGARDAYGAGDAYAGSSFGTSAARESGGGLSGEMRNLIADVEDLLKGVANIGDADVARLRERVNETLRGAKEQLRERTETLRAQASDAATTADAYVRERPWAAIGIATALGIAVGLWAGRRGGDDY